MNERANYPDLREHQFLVYHAKVNTDISSFVSEVLDSSTEEDEREPSTNQAN